MNKHNKTENELQVQRTNVWLLEGRRMAIGKTLSEEDLRGTNVQVQNK